MSGRGDGETPVLSEDELVETYPEYDGQVERVVTVPSRAAETRDPDGVIPPGLSDPLDVELYSHQVAALEALRAGDDVCVATSTSSGKTLIYGLYYAVQYLQDPETSALLVYPTKALARDQQEALTALYRELGLDVTVGIYDGDVPSEVKREVRDTADVVITNFAGLNRYLPHHAKWHRIFASLGLVVIDEAHSYTGVQGMHVAWIVRRLRRLVERPPYGADPQFVLTSATIGNPSEHGETLTGREVTVIDDDGSPRGEREIVFWNPPEYVTDEGYPARRSTHRESSEVLAHLTHMGQQTLMFAPSRQMTELDARWTEERLREDYRDRDTVIEPYNAGHGEATRRRVEEALRGGDVDGVVSTTALELGIDVGGVDATVLSGYPGSRIGFWQQIGRSGRNSRESLSVLVANNDAVDQYVVRHPDYLLEGDVEDAVADPSNNAVYAQHALVAARERPLDETDEAFFGDRLERVVGMYRQQNRLAGTLADGVRFVGDGRPEAAIDMYAAGRTRFEVVVREDGEETYLPTIDETRAYRDFHPGAVSLHRGEYYEVTSFERDTRNPRIVLEPTDASYYTETLREIDVTELAAEEQRSVGPYELHRGRGVVEEHYPLYRKKRVSNDAVIATEPTGLAEPVELDTDLCWLTVPEDRVEAIDDAHAEPRSFLGGLHAVEHGVINTTPLELRLDAKDLGGLSTRHYPGTDRATMFVYDGVEGGLGFAREIYERFERLCERTRELVAGCGCDGVEGCPGCVMDHMCGDDNEPLHTEAAIELLAGVVES